VMARGIAIAVAMLLAGAAPAERTVPHPGGGPALVIPAGSPLKFRGFDKDGGARFSGRFVLSGTFVYHCEVECEPGMTEADLDLGIVPDPGLAARLPHWKDRGENMIVELSGAGWLTGKLAARRLVVDLLAGKVPDIRGHIAVVVDRYSADFGCDYSPYYSARFISVATAPKLAKSEIEPNFGCA